MYIIYMHIYIYAYIVMSIIMCDVSIRRIHVLAGLAKNRVFAEMAFYFCDCQLSVAGGRLPGQNGNFFLTIGRPLQWHFVKRQVFGHFSETAENVSFTHQWILI